MERLKVFGGIYNFLRINDLHSSMERLKAQKDAPVFEIELHLHSSMERLKGELKMLISLSKYDLHSSMERLKVVARSAVSYISSNLHSSMERLKASLSGRRPSAASAFTFQYGEIKSISAFSSMYFVGMIYIPVWRD